MQVDVSFEVWKALTARLRDEDDTYTAVIERLLQNSGDQEASALNESRAAVDNLQASEGAFFKNVFLPNGSQLRATYKGQTYFAKILECKWIDQATGKVRSSPSQAAYSITGGNVNGWLFWLVKRPADAEWRSLNSLRVFSEQRS